MSVNGSAVSRLDVDANGFTFTARDAGPLNGRPVLLLHGFPETSWSWRPTLGALADAGFRAVAFDQRGYSPRARPAEVSAYALPHLVADVLGMADTMEMPVFDLVGHDFGGLVAWVLATRHAERVRSLTVLSTPHPAAMRAVLDAGDPGQVEASGHAARFCRPREPERMLLGADGSGTGIRELFGSATVVDGVVDEYLAVLTSPGALTATVNWYRALDVRDVDGLPPVSVPTLYLWSTGDVALGRAAAEATAQWVSGPYRFEVLEGVSHWIPEEAPEELNRLLLGHLAET